MISGHYMANTWRAHRVLLFFAFAVVGFFQVVILALVVGADLLGMVEMFYRQLPPSIRALLGDQLFAQFSVEGAVAFGYLHPMVLTMSIIVAILLPARHIAGEVETGTLELVFALPLRRSTITLSLWLFSGVALLGIVIGGWVGTGVGFWLFPEVRGVPMWGIAKAGISLWLLVFAISSYTLLFSAYARESGPATLRSAGLTLLFYFLNFTVLVWPVIDFMKYFTLFHYHRPQQLMMDESLLGLNVAVPVLVIIVCGALAVRQVNRRDIPG